MTASDVADFLAGVGLFADFPRDLLQEVAQQTTAASLPAGTWLFRQHDEGDALYVVKAGRIELTRDDPPPAIQVGLVGPGDALGELSLLLNERRSLSARAIRDSELVKLHRADVLQLLQESREFTAGVTRQVAHYLQDRALARGLADAQGSVLAVVSLDPRASIDQLRQGMAAIPARRRVTVLTGDEATSGSEADYPRILDQAERDHDRVFLLADATKNKAWHDFCLRQADRVIALVPPGLDPPPASQPANQPANQPAPAARRADQRADQPADQRADQRADQPAPANRPTTHHLDGCDLVFWCAPGHATNVPAWLDRLHPRSHHFVDPDPHHLHASLGRALRRLAGLSTGVVLSGGGARTMAHIGVLAGLTEAGIHVDRIGGPSFGALIGAMHALGMPPAEMAEHCRRELVANRVFNDYTVPRVALLRGRKLRAALHRIFGDQAIEQTPIDFFAVSADLITSSLHVHRRGRITDALQASLAMPGLLPPVTDNGRLLVDGSALNGLPIEPMAETAEGPIIAVDVVPSRLRTGRNRQSLPTIVETISRSATIGGAAGTADQRALARLVIEPDTLGAGQLEFRKIDALIALGRTAALQAVEQAGDLLGAPGAPVTAG